VGGGKDAAERHRLIILPIAPTALAVVLDVKRGKLP